MINMNKEPRFQGIGIDKCKAIMKSYPNGLSAKDVDAIFSNQKRYEKLGSIFFKKDSIVFMMNVNEKGVELKHIMSNEYDIGRFCETYFDLKERVECIGGEFLDGRFSK